MAKPPVTLTGVDTMLLTIEGRFNQEMDKKVLDVSGPFITAMDAAAKKVFKSMAVGAESGGIRAYPVMGTHTKAPSFLAPYIPSGQEWRPLNKKYLRYKKKMVLRGKMETANMWSKSGGLRRQFKTNSAMLTTKTGNTFRDKQFFNEKTGEYDSRKLNMQKPEDRLFKTIPVQGRNTGKNALGYDFEYNTWSQVPTVKYTAAHPTKATGTTMPRSRLGSMRRAIEFNVFGGFAKYVQGQLEGTGPQMSPEDFIATITLGDKKHQKNPNAKNMTDVLSGNVKNKRIKNKLYYFVKGKRQQRALIQPYMRYYFNKIMIPLARKLLGVK